VANHKRRSPKKKSRARHHLGSYTVRSKMRELRRFDEAAVLDRKDIGYGELQIPQDTLPAVQSWPF
jgi:hypothetical protein